MTKIFLLACILLVLSGCSSMPAPAARSEQEQVAALIAYSQTITGLPSDEQRRELALANQAYARDRNPHARVKLALLLTAPATGFGDDARAAVLLEPAATPPAPAQNGAAAASPLRQFAALLHAQLNERLREQRRAAQLKEQLDALKAMERNLMQRSQGRR